MSDSDGDFSDELLELAGATEKKRKRREGSSKSGAKRRKADPSMDTTSDADGPESEENDVEENPYPLDGKYIDEYDRQRLLEMPEIEREEVIAQRLEELQRITDKRNLDQMLKAQKDGDGDSVAKAAKRQHAVRGATKEKSRKLDELKAKRKAKDERKRSRGSPKRDRSSSPMEMETSDEEAEDGQITKFEQEEEKERKLLGMTVHNDEPMTITDLNKVRLTRDALAKHFLAPWFKDYVKGAASAIYFLPFLDDPCQERMCVTLWERTNIVSMRFVTFRTIPSIIRSMIRSLAIWLLNSSMALPPKCSRWIEFRT